MSGKYIKLSLPKLIESAQFRQPEHFALEERPVPSRLVSEFYVRHLVDERHLPDSYLGFRPLANADVVDFLSEIAGLNCLFSSFPSFVSCFVLDPVVAKMVYSVPGYRRRGQAIIEVLEVVLFEEEL